MLLILDERCERRRSGWVSPLFRQVGIIRFADEALPLVMTLILGESAKLRAGFIDYLNSKQQISPPFNLQLASHESLDAKWTERELYVS